MSLSQRSPVATQIILPCLLVHRHLGLSASGLAQSASKFPLKRALRSPFPPLADDKRDLVRPRSCPCARLDRSPPQRGEHDRRASMRGLGVQVGSPRRTAHSSSRARIRDPDPMTQNPTTRAASALLAATSQAAGPERRACCLGGYRPDHWLPGHLLHAHLRLLRLLHAGWLRHVLRGLARSRTHEHPHQVSACIDAWLLLLRLRHLLRHQILSSLRRVPRRAGSSSPRAPPETFTVHAFFFQWAFTAATITSGAMAERTRSRPTSTFILSGFVYPVVVHWIWDTAGWLCNWKTTRTATSTSSTTSTGDFAGSGVVHMTGGIAGLMGAAIVGLAPPPTPGHGARPQRRLLLGTFILYRWYVNPGSVLQSPAPPPLTSPAARSPPPSPPPPAACSMILNYSLQGLDLVAVGNAARWPRGPSRAPRPPPWSHPRRFRRLVVLKAQAPPQAQDRRSPRAFRHAAAGRHRRRLFADQKLLSYRGPAWLTRRTTAPFSAAVASSSATNPRHRRHHLRRRHHRRPLRPQDGRHAPPRRRRAAGPTKLHVFSDNMEPSRFKLSPTACDANSFS